MPPTVPPETLDQIRNVFTLARGQVKKLLAERRAILEAAARKRDVRRAAELRERLGV
jgi:hypothetical protein